MTSREFEIWFKRLYLPLSMYALRLCGDTDDAEDAVQEAFARVWQLLSQGVVIADMKPYMYRTVHNEVISRAGARVQQQSLDETPDISDEMISTSERDAALWRAVDALPPRCREVFLMSKRDGFSNSEIAEELGISVKTVENQMTKAYRQLRDALAPMAGRKVFFLPFL